MMRHVLISLNPTAFNDIATDYKKYEYRRKFISEECIAFTYVTTPIKAICGYIHLGVPVIDATEKIAQIAASEHEDWYSGTIKYLEGLSHGYAIPILKHIEGQPIELTTLRDKFEFTPPQLYIDLDKYIELYEFLRLHFNYQEVPATTSGDLFNNQNDIKGAEGEQFSLF